MYCPASSEAVVVATSVLTLVAVTCWALQGEPTTNPSTRRRGPAKPRTLPPTLGIPYPIILLLLLQMLGIRGPIVVFYKLKVTSAFRMRRAQSICQGLSSEENGTRRRMALTTRPTALYYFFETHFSILERNKDISATDEPTEG